MRLCVFTVLLLLARGDGEAANTKPCEAFPEDGSLSGHSTSGLYTHAAASILAAIRRLHWTNIVLISDDLGEGWGGTDRLLTSLTHNSRKVTVFHSSVAWQPHGLPAIVSLGPRGATQSLDIVLVCGKACITSVLNGAREFKNRWKSQTALRERSRWLVHPTDVTSPRWLDLSNVTMNNVAVLVLEPPSDPGLSPRARLHTLRWTTQGRQLELVAQDDGVTAPAASVFPNLQLGLNGELLRVGMNPYARFTMQTLHNGTTVYDGLDMNLLLILSEYLNFTYEIHLPEDKSWGLPLQNGSWNGLIGMLQRREIDAVLNPYEQALTRSQVVDFSAPLAFSKTSFLYRKTAPRSYGFLTYLKPFRLEVIACIFLVTLLTAMFMTAMDFASNTGEVYSPEKSRVTRHSPTDDPSGQHGWKSKFRHFLRRLQFTFWALFLNGEDKHDTRSCSGRVLVSCWWLFCVVIAATYTGNLVAFLAVSRNDFPISSLEDLVSQTQYKWGTVGSGVVHLNLKESSLPLYKKLWQGIEKFSREDPDVLSQHDTVHVWKVLHEDYIMLEATAMAEDWLYRHCELAIDSKGTGAGPTAIMFQKNSAYEPVFSDKIEALRESGLWREMSKRWSKQFENPNCTFSSSTTGERSLTLVDVQSALYVLLAGAATAAMVLVAEFLTNCVRARWRQREEREATPPPGHRLQ